MCRRNRIIKRSEQLERVMHKYYNAEEKKRDYGTGTLISCREIHTIRYIGETPGINLKRLTEMQGVTKGAASQMVSKLVDKGYVKKVRSEESESEVRLTLTELGSLAYQGHIDYHRTIGAAWYKRFSEYSDEQLSTFFQILTDLEDLIDSNI